MVTETKKQNPEKKQEKPTEGKQKLAVILVRSIINTRPSVRNTLKLLNLDRKNYCKIIDNTPSVRGMLANVKDYVTWGVVDNETFKTLTDKKKSLKKKDGTEKNVFNLAPPKKGYGRNGIKLPFSMKGALGDRKEKINDLIQRMM